MRVEVLDNSFDKNLSLFLDEISKTEFCVLGYHYPFYRDMLESIEVGEPLFLGLFDKSNLCAVLPGFVKKSDIGNVYSSLPFFGPNAGVLCRSEKRDTYSRPLIQFLSDYLSSNNFISGSIYSPFQVELSVERKLLAEDFPIEVKKFTSFIPINALTISSKVQYDLRKAKKEGITINTEITQAKVDLLYAIYQKNCRDFEIPEKPKRCIEILCDHSSTSKNVSVAFAELDQVVIGGLIMIWSGSVASYYLPCSLNEYRTIQPNTYLIAHAMEEAKRRGIKMWNWESSPTKDSGVYKFKKKWGSTDGDYSIFVKTLKGEDFYRTLGKEKLSELFQYFFVYPFNKLEEKHEIRADRS